MSANSDEKPGVHKRLLRALLDIQDLVTSVIDPRHEVSEFDARILLEVLRLQKLALKRIAGIMYPYRTYSSGARALRSQGLIQQAQPLGTGGIEISAKYDFPLLAVLNAHATENLWPKVILALNTERIENRLLNVFLNANSNLEQILGKALEIELRQSSDLPQLPETEDVRGLYQGVTRYIQQVTQQQ